MVPAIADAMGATAARGYELHQPSVTERDQELMFSDAPHQAVIKDPRGKTAIVVGNALLDGPKSAAVEHVARTLAGVGRARSDPTLAAQAAGDYARGYSNGSRQRSRGREITRAKPAPGREIGSP